MFAAAPFEISAGKNSSRVKETPCLIAASEPPFQLRPFAHWTSNSSQARAPIMIDVSINVTPFARACAHAGFIVHHRPCVRACDIKSTANAATVLYFAATVWDMQKIDRETMLRLLSCAIKLGKLVLIEIMPASRSDLGFINRLRRFKSCQFLCYGGVVLLTWHIFCMDLPIRFAQRKQLSKEAARFLAKEVAERLAANELEKLWKLIRYKFLC